MTFSGSLLSSVESHETTSSGTEGRPACRRTAGTAVRNQGGDHRRGGEDQRQVLARISLKAGFNVKNLPPGDDPKKAERLSKAIKEV